MSRQSYRYRRTQHRQFVREQPVWPLPALNGYPPVIVTVDESTHEATLAYGRVFVGNADVSSPFLMPESTPVLAVKGGVVLCASSHDDGVIHVVIDHGNGFNTEYAHLDEAIGLLPNQRTFVKAGQVIGLIRSPATKMRPLKFTLSRTDLVPGLPGFPRAVDPLDVLLGTVSIPVPDESDAPRKEVA